MNQEVNQSLLILNLAMTRHLDIKLTILQIYFQVEEPLEQITKSTLLRKDDGEETVENSTDYMEMMEGIMDR